MATIQWRPEVNALTTPQSYRARVVPRNVVGYDELAAEIAAELDIISPDVARLVLVTRNRVIARHLSNGDQVTEENAFTYSTSLSVKLDSPDDPLPADEDMLQVNVRVSRPFAREVRQPVQFERQPMTEKLPVITSAEDTKLKLANVLFAGGVLRLTGSNLYFDENSPDCGCVITGTRNGQMKQNTYGSVSNAAVLIVPDIPSQLDQWNNEYTISLTTQYSEHGTLRTGTCRRRLRTPVSITLPLGTEEPGVLTGSAESPYARITACTAAGSATVRLQAVLDIAAGSLIFNLIDMKEGGEAGQTMTLTGSGSCVLPGYAGSPVTSLTLAVDFFDELVSLMRNGYSSRLVDILEIEAA